MICPCVYLLIDILSCFRFLWIPMITPQSRDRKNLPIRLLVTQLCLILPVLCPSHLMAQLNLKTLLASSILLLPFLIGKNPLGDLCPHFFSARRRFKFSSFPVSNPADQYEPTSLRFSNSFCS